MIGLTIMEVSAEQMQAIVQWYLNNNLLNITFQKHHESVVKDVRQRTNGRFVVEFYAKVEELKTKVAKAAAGSVVSDGSQ